MVYPKVLLPLNVIILVRVSGSEEPEPRRARQQKPAPSIAAKAEPPRQLRGSRGGTPAPVASDFDLWSFRHEQESTASELDSGM